MRWALRVILGAAGVAAASFPLAMAAAQPSDTSPSAVVNCHDPDRGLIQKKLRSDCPTGRIVDDARAAELMAHESVKRVRRMGGLEQRRSALLPESAPAERTGTGFYLSRGGLMLTSAHVVAGCAIIMVEGPGDLPVRGEVVARDAQFDLALLRTKAAESSEVAFRLEELEPGEPVLTTGYPVRTLVPLVASMTDGAFLAFREEHGQPPVLVIRASLYSGNSGGPLMDRAGNVVGIIAAQLDTPKVYRTTGRLIQNIGVAVPAESILAFLKRSGVQPATVPRRTALSPDDIRELAERSVARITCRRQSSGQ